MDKIRLVKAERFEVFRLMNFFYFFPKVIKESMQSLAKTAGSEQPPV
jgi:hypothetical protein